MSLSNRIFIGRLLYIFIISDFLTFIYSIQYVLKEMFLENIVYYAMCVVAIIVGIYLLKKFVGCLVRTVITLILIAFLVWVYFTFFR